MPHSTHTNYTALDFKFVGSGSNSTHRTFQQDILERGCVFLHLINIGIRGFGGYQTFNHIDTRTQLGLQQHGNTRYASWGTFNPTAFNAEEDPELIIKHQ
jgi:hypothetical protein